jgi:leucyl aminopeptidase (aminopeptidase T)
MWTGCCFCPTPPASPRCGGGGGPCGEAARRHVGAVQPGPLRRAELREAVEAYIKTDVNADRIGEFAMGTNRSLRKLLGNMLHDEKYPSVHVAAGSPYPHVTGADWDSDAHMDFVTLEPTIEADGRRIMEAGRWLL